MFHTSPAMFQVICQVLENYFYTFGYQLDVIQVEDSEGFTRALLSCEGMNGKKEANREAARLINSQFKRKDGIPTCVVTDAGRAEFQIYVTHPADLQNLN